MTRLGSSILIRAPIEKVFARVAQHDRCADWLEFVSSASYTSEQRVGTGTSAYHTGQIMGRKMGWEGIVVEWVESERVVWQASSGEPEKMRMKALNWVKREDGGTRYGLEVEYVLPYPLLGKLMDILMVKRVVARSIQKSLERLRTVVEEESSRLQDSIEDRQRASTGSLIRPLSHRYPEYVSSRE